MKRDASNWISLEGYDDGHRVGYREGLIDGREQCWKFLSKIAELTPDQLNDIFDYDNIPDIINNMTCHSAYEKYIEFKDSRLHVGDEFLKDMTIIRGIVLGISYPENICFYILKNGVAGSTEINHLTKTGKHYNMSELEKILNEMDDTRD